jgi:hypothetical protein
LSNDHVSLRDVSNIVAEPNDAVPRTSTAVVAKGGRRKGSTKKLQRKMKRKKELVTKCATMFHEEYAKAKKGNIVSNGALKKIIDEESKKSGLSNISVSLSTIRSRVK